MKAVSGQRTGALDVPVPAPQSMQTQLLHNFGHAHHAHILLVSQHQQHSVLEFVLRQHLLQFLPGDLHSFLIGRIHHVDKSLCVLVVVFPELSDLVLTSDVPHRELHLLELNRLHVESDGRHGGYDLAQLQLVEDGRLAGSVQTQHQGTQLLLSEERVEQLCETQSHFKLQINTYGCTHKGKSDWEKMGFMSEMIRCT